MPDVVAVAAEAELQLDRLDEAQRRYQDLVRRYPNHPDLPTWQLRRGLILFMQKNYPQVVDAIRPIVGRLRSKTAQAEAYYLLGGSLVEMRQFDAAVAAIDSSLRADPGWRQADSAMLVLADALRRKGDHAQARTVIRRLVATFPKSALLDQANYWLAELAYNDGDMAAAIGVYEEMLRNWPKSSFVPDALFGLGWARLSRQEYAEAQKTFDRLISDFPEHSLIPQARFGRGTASQQLNRFEPAIEDIEAFLATKPSGKEKSDALYVLGLCRIGLGQLDQAVVAFEALLDEDPKYPGADKTLYELAWTLKSLDKPREAAQRFSELARIHPNSVLAAESLFHAAELEYDRQNFIVALTTYRDVATKTTDPFLKERALHKLACSYLEMKQFDKALESFAAQQKEFPQGALVVDAAFMEGETLARRGQFEAALAAYERMLAMSAKPADKHLRAAALLKAGQAATRLNQWDKSLVLLTKGAGEEPDSPYLPEILLEQGRAQEQLGRLDEAAQLYAAVPGKTGGEPAARARFLLGQLLARQEKHNEAIRTFYQVIYDEQELPQWQADATYEAARSFEALKNTDQAKKLYRELVTKYPESDKQPSAQKRLDALER
ncbi:MAG TPA: hypothetical protein DD670_01230 [Planctomycetaceae bacterium]|nr:hypothetical protein [Planctomycetaceae bacterium]